ncbi:Fc.00g071300.m01.CDS01 [Cosmosporella sp. VM-42]
MVVSTSAAVEGRTELPSELLEKMAASYLQRCLLCRQFMDAFINPHYLNGTTSANVVVYPRSTCQGHQPLLDKLEFGAMKSWGPSDTFTIRRPSIGPEVTFVFDRKTTQMASRYEESVALVHKADQPGHPGLGRILNPQWLDLDIMRRWISICKESHGDKCDIFAVEPVQPAWLIDVKHNCLVPGGNGKEYVALSYMWGKGKSFQTKIATLQRLQVFGSLLEEDISELLPSTISHVIKTVSVLGYQYVWIDAICIVQDDEVAKGREIERMAAIYASAAATIIPTDGAADQGISGLRNISPPRDLERQTICSFLEGSEQAIVVKSGGVLLSGNYKKRGWTFQERIMSKRRIIIANGMAHWECACAVWHEDRIPITDGQTDLRSSDQQLLHILNNYPNTQEYHEFISGGYCHRDFTYEEDCLPALSGILNLITRRFGHGFLYGIPEAFFDFLLIWIPNLGSLQRRKPSAVSGGTSILPSWSRISWKGSSNISGGSYEYIVQSQHVLTRHDFAPVVDWYTGAEPTGPWRRIRPYWYENVQNARNPEWEPPTGWSKKRVNELKLKEIKDRGACECPEGLGDYIFTHPLLPKTEFWCPIPIFQAAEEAGSNFATNTPYLSCQAQRIRAAPNEKKPLPEHFGRSPGLGFINTGGDTVGSLWPDTEETRLEAEAAIGCAPQIELVAIMKAERADQRYVLKSDPATNRMDGWIRPIYWALWVGWEDGIAYRKGVAEIHRSFWDDQVQESVFLVLG